MDERYELMSKVPNSALKTIEFGALKGKSDINPQWRYEALTNTFGLCGIGWKYEITSHHTVPVPNGGLMVFVFINLYVKDGENWSAPIPGSGGDFLIKKDKNGIHGNDEAFKMAITDALGNAAKMVGVAADIYRGLYDSKYERKASEAQYNSKQQSQRKSYSQQPKQRQNGAQAQNTASHGTNRNQLLLNVVGKMRNDSGLADKAQIMIEEMGKSSINDLSVEELQKLDSSL